MSEDHPEFEAPAPEAVVTPALVTPTPPRVDEAVTAPSAETKAEEKAEEKATGVKGLRVLSLIVMIAGVVLIVAGAFTWFVVRDQLGDEHIVVSEDAAHFAGSDVNDPFTAYAEANTIEKHALKASGGKTYSELPQDDPKRQTVMTASFLRASLFTSVVAFGVAAFAFAAGLILILVGWALLRVEGILRWLRGPDIVAVT